MPWSGRRSCGRGREIAWIEAVHRLQSEKIRGTLSAVTMVPDGFVQAGPASPPQERCGQFPASAGGLPGRVDRRPMRDITDTVAAQIQALPAACASRAKMPVSRTRAHTGADGREAGRPPRRAAIGGYSVALDRSAPVGISTGELETLATLLDPAPDGRSDAGLWSGPPRLQTPDLQTGETLDAARVWAPCFGYATVVTGAGARPTRLVPDPHEAEIVARIFHLATPGGGNLSFRQTADALTGAGMVGRDGSAFKRGQIAAILRSRLYGLGGQVELRRHGARRGKFVALAAPPLLPHELVEAASYARTQRRATNVAPRLTTGPTLLLGLVRCGSCGGGIAMRTAHSGRSRRLVCTGSGTREDGRGCGLAHPMACIEQHVVDAVAAVVLTPDRVATIVAALNARHAETVALLKARLRQALEQEERLRVERDLMLRCVEARDRAALTTLHRLLRSERAVRAERERICIYRAALADQRAGEADYRAADFADLVRSRLDVVARETRKRWLHLFVQGIVLEAGRITIRLKGDAGPQLGYSDAASLTDAGSPQIRSETGLAGLADSGPRRAVSAARTLRDPGAEARCGRAEPPPPVDAPGRADRLRGEAVPVEGTGQDRRGAETAYCSYAAPAIIVSVRGTFELMKLSDDPVASPTGSQQPCSPAGSCESHRRGSGARSTVPPPSSTEQRMPLRVSISLPPYGSAQVPGSLAGATQSVGLPRPPASSVSLIDRAWTGP